MPTFRSLGANQRARDLCAVIFAFQTVTEPEAAAASGFTVEQVRAFYAALARHGLVEREDLTSGTWARTTRVASTLLGFLEQARTAGIELEDTPVPHCA